MVPGYNEEDKWLFQTASFSSQLSYDHTLDESAFQFEEPSPH